jgi:hypothetical protein
MKPILSTDDGAIPSILDTLNMLWVSLSACLCGDDKTLGNQSHERMQVYSKKVDETYDVTSPSSPHVKGHDIRGHHKINMDTP